MDLLTDTLTSATALHVYCLKRFGPEYINWEPETVRLELGSDVPDINIDKIQAIATLLSTQQYYTYFEAFECISNVLNMMAPYFNTLTPLSPIHLCWSILEARINDADMDPFSGEVKDYIKTVFKTNGITRTPPIIKDYIDLDYKTDIKLEKEQVVWENDLNTYLKKRMERLRKEVATLK